MNILSNLPPHVFSDRRDKYRQKLTFEERCQVLALMRQGLNRNVVAIAFDIGRQTVSHIANDTSPHYRSVREEYKKLGHEEFVGKYLTQEAVDRVSAAAHHPDVHKTAREERKAKAEPETGPNHRATKHAGFHTVKPEQCAYSHRIEIKWFDAGDPINDPADVNTRVSMPGWFYRDLDGDDPDVWLHSGPESLLTSTKAYEHALLNLMDKSNG